MHYFAPLVQSQQWKLSNTKQANAGDDILAVSDKKGATSVFSEVRCPQKHEGNTHLF